MACQILELQFIRQIQFNPVYDQDTHQREKNPCVHSVRLLDKSNFLSGHYRTAAHYWTCGPHLFWELNAASCQYPTACHHYRPP